MYIETMINVCDFRILPMTALVLILTFPAPASAFTPARVLVHDFETTPPTTVASSGDTSVTTLRVSETSNTLDGSRALLFTADLRGPGAGWAGINLPVGEVPGGTDHIELAARGEAETHGLFVTLTEHDGARWSSNIRVGPEWRHYRVPLHQFTWFMGPAGREKTRLRPADIKSVDLWVNSTFQGGNGFAVDDVRLGDEIPSVMLRLASPEAAENLPVQQDVSIAVETVETTGGPVVPFSGHLWVEVDDRNSVQAPQLIPVEEGRADIPLFVRDWGEFRLHVYEPHSRAELLVPLVVPVEGVRLRFGFKGFNQQQVIFANQTLNPALLMSGSGRFPLSAHVRITDHRGQTVTAENFSIAQLSAGKGTLRVPTPGLFQVELTAVAEPVTSMPQVGDIPTTTLLTALQSGSVDRYVDLPEGVTTTTAGGKIIPLAELPTTATVVGRDRFTMWALTQSPPENAALFASQFGLSSGALFHLKESEIAAEGAERLDWHRRLGSFWGRNDLWWNEIEPASGQFTLGKLSKVVEAYQNRQITIIGILAYGAAWAKDGAAPATEDDRRAFQRYLRAIVNGASKGVLAFEVWNEPNTSTFWKPEPDPLAYRELVKATWEELRSGDPPSRKRVAAGATAGYDPVFLRHLLEDGYSRFFDILTIHPYPEALGKSPDANNLPETLAALRRLMDEHQAGDKEAWITEIGWPTMPGGVSELDQANYLVRTYTMALANRIAKVFWFNLHDWERLPWVGEFGAHTGLMDSLYRPKPAFSAYNLMNYMLAQLKFIEVKWHGNAVVYSFEVLPQTYKFGGGRMHVAWTLDRETTEEVDLSIVNGGQMTVIDYLGAKQEPELISKAQRPGAENPVVVETEADRPAAAETAEVFTGEPTYDVPDTSENPAVRTYRFRIGHEPLYIWDMGQNRLQR